MLFLSAFILLAPSIDMVAGGISGKTMPLRYEEIPSFEGMGDIFRYWATFVFMGNYGLFFGLVPDAEIHTSNYGIRIEIVFILLATLWYVYAKTRSFFRTLSTFFVVNTGIMLIASFFYFLHFSPLGIPESSFFPLT